MSKKNKNRQQRANTAQETLNIIEQGHYINTLGEQIDLKENMVRAIDRAIFLDPEGLNLLSSKVPKLKEDKESFETIIELYNETTLSAAHRLATEENEDKVLCLNFASAKNPGGGFLGGSQAQEESLARASTLYPTLTQFMEPMYMFHRKYGTCLYSHRMIYSPEVAVFRDDFDNLLDQPYYTAFITAPAVNAGCIRSNEPKKTKKIEPTMLERVEAVLATAYTQGHEVLVLGAWGCGVFRNNPTDIASYFAQFLRNGGLYAGAFRKIVFAVLDNSKKEEIFKAFESSLIAK
ncbi:MAG: TIGR02452 family protein [Aureispira sp.]|nr:TIGR02452 family protein [Aureispira sp.]